jgi:hypothetical protein
LADNHRDSFGRLAKIDRAGIAAGDFSDGVTAVQGTGRLDDRRGRAVPPALPLFDVNFRLAVGEREHVPNDLAEQFDRRRNRHEQPIVPRRCCDHGPGILRLGRNEHRRDEQALARFVEVLQVQRVVINLIDRMGREGLVANLEFQHEDDRANDDDDIYALPETRHAELEVDRAPAPVRTQHPS